MQSDSYILMPFRDNNGDLQFFDWTYIIPWGTMAEIQERGPLDVFVSNPLIQIVADLKRNVDSFTDRPIWKETDTPKEKAFKKMQHFWRIAMPSWTPKGLYWKKLEDAALGRPSKYGKEPSVGRTIAHTIFGLRTQAVDPNLMAQWKIRGESAKIRELKAKLRDIAIRKEAGNITEEEFDKRRKQYIKQIQDIAEKL